jgi:hypothetical protein
MVKKRETLLQSQRRKLAEQRAAKIASTRPTDTDENVNRIRAVTDSIIGIKDPDDIMISLLDVLTETDVMSVQSGKIYVFVYNAKTPQLLYDQNPFVAVTDVFAWGFRGLNFHWDGKVKQYTWNEVAGGLYEVYPSEVKDLQMIPFANFRLNN